MNYLRHSTIKGFENLSNVRDIRILKFLDIMLRNELAKMHEATQNRLRFLRELGGKAEDGKIAIVTSGRDCDGVSYGGHWTIVDATKEAVQHEIDEIYKWADGPVFSIEFMKPSEAREIEPHSRDLAMEAFEDGHPHCLHG